MALEQAVVRSRPLDRLGAALAQRAGRRSAAAALLAAVAALLLRLWRQRRRWRWEAKAAFHHGRPSVLQLTSPLQGSLTKIHWPYASRAARNGATPGATPGADCWRGHCPCCRRPVEAKLLHEPPPTRYEQPAPGARGRYAYVITLWGSSRAYVLGALVLGHSIRQTGTPHHLVCLHTDDVPAGLIELLSKVWDCRLVKHVDWPPTLCWEQNDQRFEKVFTKLRGMGLVEFEKILMMDIDLLVLQNIDDLFQLQAPAALKRGMNDTGGWPYKHGDVVDGRCFFSGACPGKTHSWGQGTGINAGVMLWQPSNAVLQAMLEELAEPYHPSHCRGNGPEQDYLSRFWADAPWRNISVEYNFQLHHMFNALHPSFIRRAERIRCIEDPSRIRVVHYSGEGAIKPWHRVLDAENPHMWPDRSWDEAHANKLIEGYRGYWLWVLRDKATWDKQEQQSKQWGDHCSHLSRGDDGRIYSNEATGDGPAPSGGELTPVDLPEETLQGAVKALRKCTDAWYDALASLEKSLGIDVPAALAEAVRPEACPAAAPTAVVKMRGDGPAASTAWKPASNGWKPNWFAKLPTPTRTGSDGPSFATSSSAAPAFQRVQWYRSMGGWVHEQARRGPEAPLLREAKASVVCCCREGARFVAFTWGEDGCDAFSCGDEEVSGVFVKVLGRAARRFDIADGDLSPLRIWADCASPGAVVLLAIVGLEAAAAADALAALGALGAPAGPPLPGCRALDHLSITSCPQFNVGEVAVGALAAAGVAGSGWDSAHASCDSAYASVLVPDVEES